MMIIIIITMCVDIQLKKGEEMHFYKDNRKICIQLNYTMHRKKEKKSYKKMNKRNFYPIF